MEAYPDRLITNYGLLDTGRGDDGATVVFQIKGFWNRAICTAPNKRQAEWLAQVLNKVDPVQPALLSDVLREGVKALQERGIDPIRERP